MAKEFQVTLGSVDEMYPQIRKVLVSALASFQNSEPEKIVILADDRQVNLTVLQDSDPEVDKVHVYRQDTKDFRSFYIYLINPDDDIEEAVNGIIDVCLASTD